MTANVQQACDDMNGMVNDIMVAQFPDVEIRWQGKELPNPPDAQTSWIRVNIVHGPAGQASLASPMGRRRWNRTGTLIVQCFVPLTKGSVVGARAIATALQDGMQGSESSHGVWFRGATVNEVGKDASWYQVNFAITFTYDDVR
jgi:hypothetical protein